MANLANLVIFGIPYGQQTSVCDAKTAHFLEQFYVKRHGIHTKAFSRPNGENHYVFLVYPDENNKFMDADGRTGSHFGMDLILKNQYSLNPERIYNLLREIYEHHIKGKVIQEFPNGNKKWIEKDLRANNDKIAQDAGEEMSKLIQTDPRFNFAGEIRNTAQAPTISPERN
jgi:hypothetical protein